MLVPLFGKYFLAALGVLHRFATEIKPSKLDLDNTSGRNEIMYKYFFILLLFQKTILASNVLTGVVVDIQNQTPIEGVNITCGEEGTTSNFEGKFEIKPDSDSISFSHIGFENTTVEIKNSMYIKMTRKIIKTNEVIVRSSLLKSSPFESSSSLAVFTKKDIEEQNFDHFQNAIDQIPNLNFSGGTSRPRYFQIRGIGERSQYFGEGSPNHSVGYEVDGIDLSGIGMVGSTLDINQIGDSNKFLGDITSDTFTGFFEFDGDSNVFDIQVDPTSTYGADSGNFNVDVTGGSNTFELNVATADLASTLDLDWIVQGDSNDFTFNIDYDLATNYVDVDGDSNTINFDADGYSGGYFYLDQTGNSRTFNIEQQSTLASDWLQINSYGNNGTICVKQNDGGTSTSC